AQQVRGRLEPADVNAGPGQQAVRGEPLAVPAGGVLVRGRPVEVCRGLRAELAGRALVVADADQRLPRVLHVHASRLLAGHPRTPAWPRISATAETVAGARSAQSARTTGPAMASSSSGRPDSRSRRREDRARGGSRSTRACDAWALTSAPQARPAAAASSAS